MRRVHHVIKQLEGLSLERGRFFKKLSEKILRFLRRKKVVNYRAWRMACDIFWRVEVQSLAFMSQSSSFRIR